MAHRAASGAIWVSVQTWGNQIVRFAVFLILARLLGPEAYGVLTLALTVTMVGEVLITQGGWSEALIRNRRPQPADFDSVFWFLIAASAAFVGLAFAFADAAADWFDAPEVARILPWLAWVLPLSALNVVPRAILERGFNFRQFALSSLAGTLGGGTTALALALAGWGIWSLVFYQLLQALIRTTLLWWLCPWRPGGQISMARLRGTMGFATGVLTERIFQAIDFVVARALIGRQLGAAQLGYYGLAREILQLTQRLLVAPLTRVALPAFSDLGAEPERLHRALVGGLQFLTLVALPGSIGLVIVAPDLVPLLVGPQWIPAVPAVQIAVLLAPIVPLTRLSVTLQLALGRARTVAGLAALATALFLILLLLPERLTVETVLAAFVARSYLLLPLHMALVQRLTGVSLGTCLRALTPLLASCLVMAATVLAVRAVLPADLAPFWRLSASVAAGVMAYTATLAATARPLLAEAARLVRGALGTTPPNAGEGKLRRHRPREVGREIAAEADR